MAAELGLVHSLSSGVVTRTINPSEDDWLDKVAGVLDPRMGLIRIPKADVGDLPAIEALIDYVNNSKNPPAPLLRKGDTIAVLDAENTVVDILIGCPDLVPSDFVPRMKGADHSAIVITEDKKAALDVGVGKQRAFSVEMGAKYDPNVGKFQATAAQVADAAIAMAEDAAEAAKAAP